MRRYWTCRKCKYRNERTASRKCISCGSESKPKTRRPAHEWSLAQMNKTEFGELNQTVHGVDQDVCAICLSPPKQVPLQRDHAHHDGGYPRGLLCPMCNRRLGEVERGNDAVAWLVSALAYVRAAESARFGEGREEAA